MKRMNEERWKLFFSLYVDEVLSKEGQALVEDRLKSDAPARAYVEELRRLKALLSSKQKLVPDIGFATRLSAALEEQKMDERSLLPFPRRYLPAVTALAAVILVVTGVYINTNKGQFSHFFSEKSQAVRDVYEKNVLQGSLLPLFSKVDKDQALQFSLFGTLALDDKSETALRVDEQTEKGYRIEVGKDSKKNTPITFDHFLAEVKPTIEQKYIIDSLLELTGHRIESSVLIGDNNVMAIAPDLPRLNRMMVTNIASCLEPPQRIRFERLLEVNDAPYSVSSRSVPDGKKVHVLQKIPTLRRNNDFVIITPDTMMYSRIQVDFDSLRRRMEKDILKIELHREALLKKMMAKDFQRTRRNIALPIPPMVGSEEFFSVEISVPGEENEQQHMRVVIQPRVRKQGINPESLPRSIRIHRWNDTAATPANTVP